MPDAMVRLHQHRFASDDPERLLGAGFDAGARTDALIDIDDGVERQGLRNSRLDRFGQPSAEVSVLFAVTTVIENQRDKQR
jgi:hypothetical protein